jgi:hypothetical protein
MPKFFKSRVGVFFTVIGSAVDVFSLIQIFKQTRFKMPALLTNEWFWLFVLVSVSFVALFVYFTRQDDKQAFLDYKTEMGKYKDRLREEFYKRMAEETRLGEQHNKLYWEVENLKTELANLKREFLVPRENY